jgi:hypothetical protein
VIKYPEYVDTDVVDQAFDRIAQAVTQKRVEFLFGAGMSIDSGVPAGPQLAQKLLRLFFPETGASPPSDNRLAEWAREIPFELLVEAVEASRGKNRADLTEDLTKLLIAPDYDISDAHRHLLAVCNWLGSPPVVNRIFTTNFDRLLDKAFGRLGKRITQANTREIVDAQRTGLVPILYLHGTIEESSYRITESDVFDSSFNSLQTMFRTALAEADAFVFVGYSMNDPDLRRVYRDYRSDIASRRELAKFSYVVGPATDSYQYRLGRKLWEVRGAIWLPFTAADFFAQLKAILEAKGDNLIRQFIMQKYRLKTDDEYQDKVNQTSEILHISENDAIRFLVEAHTKTGKPS